MSDIEQEFISSVKENYPKNADKIIDAYYFAKDAHNGVLRKSGEPYIIHPLAVAKILIENNLDYSTIIAGLLHDVVEDTKYSLDDINEKFGETVAKLVDGVTKIDNLTLEKENLTEADSMKRLLLAMGDDVRVIFIKLADRLHNMRTIQYLSRERQLKMAIETNELFIPIAERMGVRKIRSELQELTFKCIHPDDYNKIKIGFDKKLEEEKLKIGVIEDEFKGLLSRYYINCTIHGWPERYYSIYKKMQTKGMSRVFGLILLKVLVPTDMDCYRVLGILHKNYNHIPSQIKDFISLPKPNGYKSLHTVLTSKNGDTMFKVMIRTPQMDEVCENGIASLWENKDSDVDFFERFERYNTFKNIVLSEKDEINNTDAFIDAIKTDLNIGSTWVFAEDYSPICLKADKPTAIDFAYLMNSESAHNALSAVINSKKASISTELSSGDVVQIVYSKQDKAPSRSWLFCAKTPEARKKIREYFNAHITPELVELGKNELEQELKKIGYTLNDLMIYYTELVKDFDFSSPEDLFSSLALKSINKNQILKYIFINHDNKKVIEDSPVEIEGAKRFVSISFPKCCSAIPGDEICGVISKNGIAIHNMECTNLKKIRNLIRLNAKWKENINQLFNVNLKIIAKNKVGFASRLFNLIASEHIDASKIEAKSTNMSECEFRLSVFVKNNIELDRLISRLKSLEEVKIVSRIFE